MTNEEKLVVAKLLEIAEEHFSNHGCNDFDLASVMPDRAQRQELMRAYHQRNGDPEEFDPDSDYRFSSDFMLMWYFSLVLADEARDRALQN